MHIGYHPSTSSGTTWTPTQISLRLLMIYGLGALERQKLHYSCIKQNRHTRARAPPPHTPPPHTHTHTHTHAPVHAHIHTHARAHTHTRARATHTHTHIHAHTHTHTTHTRNNKESGFMSRSVLGPELDNLLPKQYYNQADPTMWREIRTATLSVNFAGCVVGRR